ncbi:replicative DNA helicase [Kitasatospora sp. NPDC001574]
MKVPQQHTAPDDDYQDPHQDDLGEQFERVPPQDIAAEQAVLGSMLLSPAAVADVAEIPLTGPDYYRPAHQLVHAAITALHGRGERADPITVTDELTRRGELVRVGGAGYIHGLVNAVPVAASADHYGAIVRERAILRRLVEAGTRIAAMGYAAEGDLDEIVAAASAEIAAVVEADTAADDDFEDIADLVPEVSDMVEAAANADGGLTGVTTGFQDLDQLTGGLQPGQMIIVAGRPGMGKSTLGMDLVRACTMPHDYRAGYGDVQPSTTIAPRPAAYVTLEMSKQELAMRTISAEGRLGLHQLRTGTLDDQGWDKFARTGQRVMQAPLLINETAQSFTEIQAKLRRLKRRRPDLALVVIDYLQLITSGGTRRRGEDSRQQEVSDISRSVKLLAKELRLPIVVLAQLNRGPELRSDHRPMTSDLRESGSLEQDADLVVLLYRDDAYEAESPRAGEADLIVSKHRNGPTATITVAFQGHYSRFVDMTRDVT